MLFRSDSPIHPITAQLKINGFFVGVGVGAEKLDISPTLPWMLQGVSFISLQILNFVFNTIKVFTKKCQN